MKDLGSTNVEQLLAVKAKVEAAIASKIEQERKQLTASLRRLDALASNGNGSHKPSASRRRAGDKSRLPIRYRNPLNAKETWAGRGLKPRWLAAALKGGKKKLSDFALSHKQA
jgi:DNA-binding protein H-NS